MSSLFFSWVLCSCRWKKKMKNKLKKSMKRWRVNNSLPPFLYPYFMVAWIGFFVQCRWKNMKKKLKRSMKCWWVDSFHPRFSYPHFSKYISFIHTSLLYTFLVPLIELRISSLVSFVSPSCVTKSIWLGRGWSSRLWFLMVCLILILRNVKGCLEWFLILFCVFEVHPHNLIQKTCPHNLVYKIVSTIFLSIWNWLFSIWW